MLAAFGLAACGGGGGSTGGDTGMTGGMTGGDDGMDGDGDGMDGDGDMAGPTAESTKADAADAITDATAAGMAAEQAVEDAINYAGMLTTRAVRWRIGNGRDERGDGSECGDGCE